MTPSDSGASPPWGWRDSRLDLTQHVALITGAASGIGRATSIALARQGVRALGLVDQNPAVHEFAGQTNSRLGREALIPFCGDVTDSALRRRVVSELEQRFGAVSICVPAAGITRDRLAARVNRETGEVEIYSEEDFRRVIEIDLVAPVYWGLETIASVARQRLRRGLGRWSPAEGCQGAVIFIGSVSSAGNRGQIAYASAKAGLEGAQATLASEAMFHGVRCAIIHPGYTDTPMVQALGQPFVTERILPRTQLGRLILPEEIADAIVFMIRNAAVSGQLWVDAGWHPDA